MSEINEEKNPFLSALGERVRSLRARRGLTRKALAQSACISERHLANLEYGEGNASILVLHQVADALQCSLIELIGDVTTSNPEWLMLRELLGQRSEDELRRLRVHLTDLYADNQQGARTNRIALIGLRGAGKSTLGQMLSKDLGCAFVELSREIEKFAGCSVSEIHNLYGLSAYRRYERRALEETIQIYSEVIIATPGGVVSDSATLNTMLSHCYTVWLQAKPEDHLSRVAAQGDMRPMAGSTEALDDLKLILEGRTPFYAKANMSFDTSAQSLEQSFQALRTQLRSTLKLPI